MDSFKTFSNWFSFSLHNVTVWSSIHSKHHMVKSCGSVPLAEVISSIGYLLGRSSLSFISFDEFWPLNLLIATIMMYCGFEAIYMTIPVIWIIFILVFCTEFISGCTTISIFYRLTSETPPHLQVFALCAMTTGISMGLIMSAALVIPLHDAICKLPSPI